MTYIAVTKAGFDNLQWGRRSSSGHFVGSTSVLTAASTGSSASMARHKGALNANVALPTPTEINILGDDTVLSIYQFDATQSIAFDLEMTVRDFAFKQAFSGLSYVTEAEEVMMPLGVSGLTRNGMILQFSSHAKSQDSGALNTAGFSHVLLFNCEISDLGAGAAHQGAGSWRYRVTANITDTLPDGRLIADVFPTVPGGVMAGMEFNSVRRVSYSALVGDGLIDDITTAYDPHAVASAKATVETTGFAAATVSAVAANALTLSAAPTSGKFAVGRYEFAGF